MHRTVIIVLISLILGSAHAQAHAFLDHAEPRVGNSVGSAPREVSLWFTQNLEVAVSTIEVRESAGSRVYEGKPQVSAGVMRIGLKPLPPGTYMVHWRVLSVDTHIGNSTI